MLWRRKIIRRHGARRQERLHASLVLASVTVLCCFRRIFPQVLPSGWTLGLLGCVGGARSHATPRHWAVSAISACYRRPRRLSASNRGQELHRPSVSPGLFLAPGGILPLAPRIRAGHPLPGVFPGAARGWVPLARSRPGGPRFGRMSEFIGDCEMSVAPQYEIWTLGHFGVMVKNVTAGTCKHYGLNHKGTLFDLWPDSTVCQTRFLLTGQIFRWVRFSLPRFAACMNGGMYE